ncbi:MAG: hypothetical protein M3081_10750 [Gemmatimonadota bacterium]|nr:hypothetical protein [Gemmatimonadota bacterium]
MSIVPPTIPPAGVSDQQHSAPAASERVMPREVIEFLMEMSTALQRHAIYPRGHPMLNKAVESLTKGLDGLLRARDSLSMGISREQLVVDGVATDVNVNVLRDLAHRLHRHHVGSMKFVSGLPGAELGDLLSVLAVDPNLAEQTLGPITEQLSRWPHVRMSMLTYEKLTLSEDEFYNEAEIAARMTMLWLSLATLGMGAENAEGADPESLAKMIEARSNDAAYDSTVVNCLLEITEALRTASGIEAETLRRRVSQLIRQLRPETLRRLLALGGDAEQRRLLVENAASELAVDAVLTLLKAAAEASNQTISHAMLRLLAKLALQAEEGGAALRAGANQALREQVQQLVERWDADLLNPDSYQKALDRMSRLKLLAMMREREHPVEARRLVGLALEADMLGAPVWRAIAEMLRTGEISVLLDLLDRAPEGCQAAVEVWGRVATAENVRRMLKEEQVDLVLLDRLAARMGGVIIEPLLDALETAEARATRRKLLDLLSGFGDPVGPFIVQRLDMDAPWFVLRNLLTLLYRLPEMPGSFAPIRFMTYPDPRVRREAFKLLLRMPSKRDEAVTTAMADKDERIVQMALIAAGESCPRAAVPVIIRRVNEGTLHAELRLLAVRVAAAVKSPATLEWLLTFTAAKRRWFRKRTLARKSPEMIAALTALATQYRNEAGASNVLALASRDTDPEIRAAVKQIT